MRIKYQYQRILRDLMKENGISPIGPASPCPSHVVPKDAGFTEVVQHTDSYVGEGNDARPDAWPHYRYRRYMEVLQRLKASKRRRAHVDIGCGAGLFSWVFLDWATSKRVPFDRVELYGLDHSTAMISLAQKLRTRLIQYVPNYPELHYCYELESLLDELTENHRKGTDYTITFGHVLVQAHNPHDMDTFTQIITHIQNLMDTQSNCVMMAVDAGNWPLTFAEGWSVLLSSLEGANIWIEETPVKETAINDSTRSKIATLSLAR